MYFHSDLVDNTFVNKSLIVAPQSGVKGLDEATSLSWPCDWDDKKGRLWQTTGGACLLGSQSDSPLPGSLTSRGQTLKGLKAAAATATSSLPYFIFVHCF